LPVAASHIITAASSKYNVSLDSVLHHLWNQCFLPSELSDGSILLQQQKPFMWKHYGLWPDIETSYSLKGAVFMFQLHVSYAGMV